MELEQDFLMQARQQEYEGLVDQLSTNEANQLRILGEYKGIGTEQTKQIKDLFAAYNKTPEKTGFDKMKPLLAAGAYLLDSKSKNKIVRTQAGAKLKSFHDGQDDEAKALDVKRRQGLIDNLSGNDLLFKNLRSDKDLEFKGAQIQQKNIGTKLNALKGKDISVGDKLKLTQESRTQEAINEFENIRNQGGSWADLSVRGKIDLINAGYKPEQTAEGKLSDNRTKFWLEAFKVYQEQYELAPNQEERDRIMGLVEVLANSMLKTTVPPKPPEPDPPGVETLEGVAPANDTFLPSFSENRRQYQGDNSITQSVIGAINSASRFPADALSSLTDFALGRDKPKPKIR